MKADTKRGPGRPRTRPVGARKLVWYATDAELAPVRSAAAAAGISVEELVRRRVLRTSGRTSHPTTTAPETPP